MNQYTISVTDTSNPNTKKKKYTFTAENYRDAYFKASQLILTMYPNLSDDSCDILSDSDMSTWESDCDDVYENDGLDISDIIELEDE